MSVATSLVILSHSRIILLRFKPKDNFIILYRHSFISLDIWLQTPVVFSYGTMWRNLKLINHLTKPLPKYS